MSSEQITAVTTPLAEWRAEMAERGMLDCKFVCPACGNEASPNDFRAADADPQRAPKECIGRVGPNLGGCDWAAFGLFRGPHFVSMPEGDLLPVFAFAESSV